MFDGAGGAMGWLGSDGLFGEAIAAGDGLVCGGAGRPGRVGEGGSTRCTVAFLTGAGIAGGAGDGAGGVRAGAGAVRIGFCGVAGRRSGAGGGVYAACVSGGSSRVLIGEPARCGCSNGTFGRSGAAAVIRTGLTGFAGAGSSGGVERLGETAACGLGFWEEAGWVR